VNVVPFFDHPPELRRVMYSTNAIESLNAQVLKVTRKRGAFPTPEAVSKEMYLALQRASRKRRRPIRDWPPRTIWHSPSPVACPYDPPAMYSVLWTGPRRVER